MLVVQRSIRSNPDTAEPSSEPRSRVGEGIKLGLSRVRRSVVRGKRSHHLRTDELTNDLASAGQWVA